MNMVNIPEVTTERLRLRPILMSDFDSYAAFFATERAQYMGGPKDRRGAWVDFASDTAIWQLRGYGSWTIESRDTGAIVGWTGIIQPFYYDEPELGWMLLGDFEGKGYAYEAVFAARDFCAQAFGLTRLASFIVAENRRSIALAERLGATLEEERDRGHGPFYVYRHPAPEVIQ